jgi:amino acid transporter
MSSAQRANPVEPGSDSQRLGRPVLTTLDAIAQSLAIGPIFSSAFVAFLIAGAAGGAAPLAVLVGAVGVLALGWVITLYAQRYAGAGAIYDYLRRFIPALGLFAAGIYFIGTLVLAAGGYLAIGLQSSSILQQYLNLNVSWWVLALVGVALLFTLNHLGIRLTTRTQLTLTALSAIPLLILAFVIIAKGGDAGNTWQAFNPASAAITIPTAALFPGILFAILLFIGFETSASLGEETANPRRSIPRAVVGSVIISAVLYLLIVYASDIGFGLKHTDKWAMDPFALDTLATRYVGSWLAILIDIAVLLDALAVMSAFMATTARGWFALARHNFLPAPLARISARFRTPLGGNLLVLIVSILLIGGTAVYQVANKLDTPTTFSVAFGIASTMGSLLIELIYIVLAACAIRFLLEDPAKWWRWLFLLVAIVTPFLGIYGSVVPFPPPFPTNIGVYCTIAGIVIAGVWTLVIWLRYPKRLGDASQPHAWEVGEATAPAE